MANQAVFGIEGILKGFDKLKASAVPVARAMGAAMGVEVRDEAKIRAPVLAPGNEGYDNQRAGQLKDAIYVAYDGRRSILGGGNGLHIVYGVSWNRRKAPHGHFAEFGHWMPYEAAQGEDGKWFTPIAGSQRVEGRKRNTGVPLSDGGFFVHASPFLGPAFDSKLSKLSSVAAAAGRKTFAEAMT